MGMTDPSEPTCEVQPSPSIRSTRRSVLTVEVALTSSGRLLRYSREVTRDEALDHTCRRLGVLAVYLFGSRADEGRRMLRGDNPDPGASDLDVGVVFGQADDAPERLARLQVALEDVFVPLRVDLVPLDSVDPLFQFRATDGHRVFTADSHAVDVFELIVMREAADLLPVERAIERERFGVTTT